MAHNKKRIIFNMTYLLFFRKVKYNFANSKLYLQERAKSLALSRYSLYLNSASSYPRVGIKMALL